MATKNRKRNPRRQNSSCENSDPSRKYRNGFVEDSITP
nr:MAG TPA: hypothetical protein [Microviridae sp.]